MDAVRALLGVQRVAPAGQRELARRVGARVRPRDPSGGAGDVDDRYRTRATRPRTPSGAAAAAAPRSAGPAPRSSASCGARCSPSPSRRSVPRQAAPGVVDQQVQLAVLALHALAHVRGASRSVRSTAITVAPPSSAASARSRSSRRATSTRRRPGSRASRRAVASPIPLEAPVIRATKVIGARKPTGRRGRTSDTVAYTLSGEHPGLDHGPVLHGRDRLRDQLDRRADAVLPRPLPGRARPVDPGRWRACCPTGSSRSPGS